MEIALSQQAASTLDRLIGRGAFRNREEAVELAIARLAEADEAYIADLRTRILEAHESLDAGQGRTLSRDLADEISREADSRDEHRRAG